MKKWLAAGAFTLAAPVCANGFSLACYAAGRAQSADHGGLTLMAYAPGKWLYYGGSAGLTVLWIAAFAAFFAWTIKDRRAWLKLAVPGGVFCVFSALSLTYDYACNVF